MSKPFMLTQNIFRVLGRETHILESPLWEKESSLVISFNQQIRFRNREEEKKPAKKQADQLDEPW